MKKLIAVAALIAFPALTACASADGYGYNDAYAGPARSDVYVGYDASGYEPSGYVYYDGGYRYDRGYHHDDWRDRQRAERDWHARAHEEHVRDGYYDRQREQRHERDAHDRAHWRHVHEGKYDDR